MEAFQLRLWDGRLGRWLTVDPYGEFHSPYVGMGNNPVNLTDPDGGCTKCPKNANVGDSYYHSDYGDLAYSVDGKGVGFWSTADGATVLNDVVITRDGSNALASAGRTALDFVPLAGSGMDIYEGFRDGNGWQVALGATFLVVDILTLGSGSLVKGAVKTIGKEVAEEVVEQGAKQLLLTAGKKALHKHHVLPQQFRKWFTERGISNIDDFTVQLSQKGHLSSVHGSGKWNKKWKEFIDANPNANPSEIFHQAEGMLKDLGLHHLPYVKY